MALILSIETATPVCSVALHAEAQPVAIQTLYVKQSHAESLLPIVKHLLAISAYTQDDLAAVALSSGPGSYTGLRIGAASAKGLCQSLQIPLISINTLETMAYGMQAYNMFQGLLCPMIDARRMEVYCLLIDAQGHTVAPTQAKIIDEDSFQAELQETPILFFGDGAAKCKVLLAYHPNALFVDDVHPTAHHIGALAYAKFQKATFEDLAQFTPNYLKPFQDKSPAPQ
ncbi:MAG: tRNA (adenosine(37)-N6)-threonylcarbamoyltransferase complex dimerization subunit type 1 TsaB [Bacteroidota bacterium]